MERRNRWLGYLVLGLGAIALIAALGSHLSGPWAAGRGPWHSFEGRRSAAAPAPRQAPAAGSAPAPGQAPGDFDARHPGAGLFAHGPRFDRGFGRRPRMPLFAWPFMMLGGLRNALLALVLIALGVRVLRGRSGPSSGPHTGETQRL